VSGGTPPAGLVVALFAWRYGRAFEGARELRKWSEMSTATTATDAQASTEAPPPAVDGN
jgi:hypothetical protein